MFLQSILFASFVAIIPAACSGSSKAPVIEDSKTTAQPSTGHLAVAAFQIVGESEGNRQVIDVDDSGKVSINGKVTGKVHPDGRGTNTDGRVVATLSVDGALAFPGEEESGHIDDDGAWTSDDKPVLAIAADGIFGGPLLSEASPGTTLQVVGGPALHRTAMFVYTFASQPAPQ